MKKYHLTSTLQGIIGKLNLKQLGIIQQMINHYITEYKRVKQEYPKENHKVAFFMQNEVNDVTDNKVLEIISEGKSISCGKGCSFCCYLNVDITDDEADLLHFHIKRNKIDIDTQRLEKQSRAKDYDKMPLNQRKCVFLDDKGCCKVYDVRPIACRKLFVASPKEDCDTSKNYGKEVARVFDVQAETMASATLNATDNGRLSTMLLKSLNKDL